jgi:hypothetical protein
MQFRQTKELILQKELKIRFQKAKKNPTEEAKIDSYLLNSSLKEAILEKLTTTQ